MLEPHLDIESDNVLRKPQIVRWRYPTPVGVVEQFHADSRPRNIAKTNLCAHRIDFVLVEAVQRFHIGNPVKRLRLPHILPSSERRLNAKASAQALDVRPLVRIVVIRLATYTQTVGDEKRDAGAKVASLVLVKGENAA